MITFVLLLLVVVAGSSALRLNKAVGGGAPQRDFNDRNATIVTTVSVRAAGLLNSFDKRTIVFHVGADAGVQLSVAVSPLNEPKLVAAFARLRFHEVVEFVDLNGLSGYQRGDFVIGRWPLVLPQFSPLVVNNASDDDNLLGIAVTAAAWGETLFGWKDEWNARLLNWTAAFDNAKAIVVQDPTAFGGAPMLETVDDEVLLGNLLALTTLQAVAKSSFAASSPKRQIIDRLGAALRNLKQEFTANLDAKMDAVKKAMRGAVRHQQRCFDQPAKHCATARALQACDEKRLIVYDAQCCPLCDAVAVERRFESSKPAKRAADQRLEFEFAVQADGGKKRNKVRLDASTIKFSLKIRNPTLRARSVGLPASIGVRFSIDVKAEQQATFKALPRQRASASNASDELALWASEPGAWAPGSERFELEDDETALLLNDGAGEGVPQLVLAWQTWALVNNCRAANDEVNVTVTTYRSLTRHNEKAPWSRVPLQPESLVTTTFFASIDLSRCTLQPTAIVIDPNVAVVTEGEEAACDDDELSGECNNPPGSGSASTVAIIAGCVLAGVAVVAIVVAVALSRRRSRSAAKASEGLE